jgi:hypothetical protein
MDFTSSVPTRSQAIYHDPEKADAPGEAAGAL